MEQRQLKIGVIGGSGLGQLFGDDGGTRHEIDTPFGRPSDVIVETAAAGVPVFTLRRHGPGHLLNPSRVPYRANLFALKMLGCTHVIASGAVGSLREEFKPRDLVVPDQIIDKTTGRAGTFFDAAAVHVEMAEPFCPVLRQLLLDAGGSEVRGQRSGDAAPDTFPPAPADLPPLTSDLPPVTVHDRGCYVAMEGPAFGTRAESLMHRVWGGDLIGMTLMPEAKLAREAEMSYAAVALVTDFDSWKARPAPAEGEPPADPASLLAEIIGNLEAASANAIALIRRAVDLAAGRADVLLAAPPQSALKLAIWSDKSAISAEQVRRLAPLWGTYLDL